LIVDRGAEAVQELPKSIRKSHDAVAETIENNVRKLIIDEQPINPKYYEKMSELLDALIEQRRQAALDYEQYLAEIVALTRKIVEPPGPSYPKALSTPAKRSLYDNLQGNETLALAVDQAIRGSRQDDWRNNLMKVKKVRLAILRALQETKFTGVAGLAGDVADLVVENELYLVEGGESLEQKVDRLLDLAKNQHEY